ncbi:Inner membrane protein YghB [Aquimixticola soesokkakensis]|uniref:Inner membrane protein YghB n=1 Tax=Aquimixticola soesokkakensis TaxID=1519096 RepID=A0A1Y5T9C3_9RHOB|nr:phosphatase PAP2 family protein [Aquimixticola soesokkakensis]SLN55192.1 Inner membrane protein YghB [Aquimixticola soesokkakensis]
MPHSLDQLLPSLQSLGIWTYWFLAACALLEAVVLTGMIAPGALAVIAGGILVQRGVIDFFDLAWFVAGGTILGSEISYRLGRLATRGLATKEGGAPKLPGAAQLVRARGLLQRYGGFAMVVGRFLGPLSAFVPFAAAMAGMERRRFTLWNIASALPYALTLPALGYFFGSAAATMGAATPRLLAFGGAVALITGALWLLVWQVRRSLPPLIALCRSLWHEIRTHPRVEQSVARHPRSAAALKARLRSDRFSGLPATFLALVFAYLCAAYAESTFDFVTSAQVTETDLRVANVFFALRSPPLITLFGTITDFGSWRILVTLLIGMTLTLALLRRRALVLGLWIVVIGNQCSVTLLKILFNRPRSPLGYFVETSGSFPSGHAAASVAIWGMFFYVLWKIRALSGTLAGLLALTFAFFIGLSRLYLVEHYLSDVLNGYLVGALWLVVGIALCEALSRRPRVKSPQAQPLSLRALSPFALAICAAVSLTALHKSPLNSLPPLPALTLSDPAQILTENRWPQATTTLLGRARAPLSSVFASPDAATLGAALATAGWQAAPVPTPRRLAQALWAQWTQQPLPAPLVVPLFWRDLPQDLAFALPPDPASARKRWHLRLWQTDVMLPDGRALFVASLTFEDPLEDDPSDDPANAVAQAAPQPSPQALPFAFAPASATTRTALPAP